MIVGSGDIARVLKPVDNDKFIFFASGVSNSKETRQTEFNREKDLLFAQDINKHLVYFGSLSIFYSDTPYAQHKRKMEQYVKMFPHHTIIRIGNIDFGTNPHTLINFMRNERKRGRKLEIQNTYRYVTDKDEFLHWISLIPEWNCEMNVPGRRMTIKEIVKKYVH